MRGVAMAYCMVWRGGGGFTTSSSLIKGGKKKGNKRIRWLLEMA